MSWLLVPASDRAALRRVVARIDQILGYPRMHRDDEPGVVRGAESLAAYTETGCAILVHDDTGTAALHGTYAVSLDGIVDALRDRLVDDGSGVRQRLRDLIAARGWQVRPSLPGVPEAWSQVAPRDGAAGSSDGVPIPEGSE